MQEKIFVFWSSSGGPRRNVFCHGVVCASMAANNHCEPYMSQSKTGDSASAKEKGAPAAEKKKRLSSALRDNLRRRKAAPRPKKPADMAQKSDGN
jgi:hypothetical protein